MASIQLRNVASALCAVTIDIAICLQILDEIVAALLTTKKINLPLYFIFMFVFRLG